MIVNFSRKTVIRTLLFFFLFIVTAALSYSYFTLSRMVAPEPVSPLPQESQTPESFDISPLPTPASASGYTILLLGYGGPGHSGESLTDTIIAAHFEPEKRTAALISIPRDLLVPLPKDGSSVRRKINDAYALGGGQLAKQTVGAVIGMPIGYFVAVSFEGLKEAIDILGGVDVRVPVTFDDYYYPVVGKENETCGKSPEEVQQILTTLSGFAIDKQFPCRFEQVHFDAGVSHMDGTTALVFVRSRHSAQHGGDFARSERAQALLVGIKDKLFSLGALDDVIPFFNRLSHSLQTDLDAETVKALLKGIGEASEYSLTSVYLTDQNVLRSTTTGGQFVLIPKDGEGKWEGIWAFVKEQSEKNDKSGLQPTPSPKVPLKQPN